MAFRLESLDTLYTGHGDGDLKARNQLIQQGDACLMGAHFADLTPSTPMAVRNLITAQWNDLADNGQNVRSRTLFHATPIGIGWGLTLAARVLRVVVRTGGLVISIPVAIFQQSRYGRVAGEGEEILKYNLVVQDLKSVGYEWIDLAVSAFVVPLIGTVNTVAPQAISTQFLARYYTARTLALQEKNEEFNAARKAYWDAEEQKRQAWNEGRS